MRLRALALKISKREAAAAAAAAAAGVDGSAPLPNASTNAASNAGNVGDEDDVDDAATAVAVELESDARRAAALLHAECALEAGLAKVEYICLLIFGFLPLVVNGKYFKKNFVCQ